VVDQQTRQTQDAPVGLNEYGPIEPALPMLIPVNIAFNDVGLALVRLRYIVEIREDVSPGDIIEVRALQVTGGVIGLQPPDGSVVDVQWYGHRHRFTAAPYLIAPNTGAQVDRQPRVDATPFLP
jgi:hypothetical protein